MPIPGIAPTVPIKVEENGWPTGHRRARRPSRSQALRDMVGAVHDFRGTFNVTDYRWFDLRDHNSREGELPVAVRAAARRLLGEAGVRESSGRWWRSWRLLKKQHLRGTAPAPRLILRARCRGGRLSVRVGGPGVASVKRVAFYRGARKVGGDGKRPFRKRLRWRGRVLTVRTLSNSGQRGELRKRVRRC